MIYRVRLLFVLIVTVFISIALSSCSGARSIAGVDECFIISKHYGIEEKIYEINLANCEALTNLSDEPAYTVNYRLEVVGDDNATAFIGVGGPRLEVAVFDNRGKKMSVLPAGYEVRWFVEEEGWGFVEASRTSIIDPVGATVWADAMQITDNPVRITAQLYGLGASEAGHSAPIDGAFVFFEVSVEYLYFQKYRFLTPYGQHSIMMFMVGYGYVFGNTDPRVWNSSEWYSYPITLDHNGRMMVHTDGSQLYSIGEEAHIIREITENLWEDFRIQAFVYGGDITLVSPRGILSQIPELHEDNFHFDISASPDFDIQYILYHEISYSSLLHMLGLSESMTQ